MMWDLCGAEEAIARLKQARRNRKVSKKEGKSATISEE
jgi:hypothetical protein